MVLKPQRIHVRFVGAEGGYQSIETQAVRIHKSLERWGGDRVESHLSLLPQDFFKRHGLFRQAPLRDMQGLIEGMQIIIVVKSSLFRGLLEVAQRFKEMCRQRGALLASNPCDGPGADTGDTSDVFSEETADYVLAVSRLQKEALSLSRPADEVLLVGHASRLETSNRLEHRKTVKKVIWENPIHHNPHFDPRKVGMPRKKYEEFEDALKKLLANRGVQLTFIDAWRETQSYEEWEKMMLDSDIAIELKALGNQYVDYQAQKPAVKVLNYMALGLPVICDPLPAYRDLGEDEKELLFADSLEGWEQKLTRLIDDFGLRARLGEAARKAAERYSIENVTRRYMDFFGIMVEKPAPGLCRAK